VVKEAVIDDATRRILRVKFELGLFDDINIVMKPRS
jgi:beta-glucosidase-like glycosyl hydrolase